MSDNEILRQLPSVTRLLELFPDEGTPRPILVDAARIVISRARERILSGQSMPDERTLVAELLSETARQTRSALRPAINGTGVVLNTGLGRAVLAREAIDNMARVAAGHSTLEVDAETGQRGARAAGVVNLLRKLTGCEDAVIVNNNAAAVLLSIRTLAAGREVVISRGQLVEIGGQFRVPDVISSAGARMVEVGTTNKTHLSDYSRAVSPETALMLEVHPSNFRVVGFTQSVPLGEIVRLARSLGVPTMSDLGSGALVSLACDPAEPTVSQTVATGVDICTLSGDKLLGGPQCGIIVGRRELIARMKGDPLMRALRVDKLTLAALEATLALYLDPATVSQKIPTLRAITRPSAAIQQAAARTAARLQCVESIEVDVVSVLSQVGGGTLPGEELTSSAVAITSRSQSLEEFAKRLRTGETAVFGRVSQGRLLLDMRTVAPEEEDGLVAAVMAAARAESGDPCGP